MKFKALRKKETKEFAVIEYIEEKNELCTCSSPKLMGLTVTIEVLKKYYEEFSPANEINFDELELIEFDLIENDVVGADIRNKLTPSLNLVRLLSLYFRENNKITKKKLEKYIRKEMKQSEKSIKYIANLL